MPNVTIDGKRLAVDQDSTILEAARAAGVQIPTLCWYPKLPTVGNCRICLASVAGSEKLLPACATPVSDGMDVTTESDSAVQSRREVLSLLLERYPSDHLQNGGRSEPHNEFEEYVVRYGVTPTPVSARDLDLRRRNSIVISVRVSDRVARKQVFVPFHFREAAANLLTNPVLEPHAKMPELKDYRRPDRASTSNCRDLKVTL